ncbi:hypothetical protein WI25_12770 [Burkholderia cepacia]|nr:hypothetical protein WI25_12770 [Burkholderia cepacia]
MTNCQECINFELAGHAGSEMLSVPRPVFLGYLEHSATNYLGLLHQHVNGTQKSISLGQIYHKLLENSFKNSSERIHQLVLDPTIEFAHRFKQRMSSKPHFPLGLLRRRLCERPASRLSRCDHRRGLLIRDLTYRLSLGKGEQFLPRHDNPRH